MRTAIVFRVVPHFNLKSNIPVCLSTRVAFAFSNNLDSVLPQDLRYFFRDVWIFSREQLACRFERSSHGFQSAGTLSELQPDVSAAQNQ